MAALPAPEAGLVIHFNYLWRRERDDGGENARYPRPAVIVVATRRSPVAATVVVVPITHSPPGANTRAIALPLAVKRHLGLDDEPSWIVVDETNEFVWPGVDLQQNSQGQIAYGVIPNRLLRLIADGVLESAHLGRLGRVQR